jgi:hypothetical protein
MRFNGRYPRAFCLLMPIFLNLCSELSLIKAQLMCIGKGTKVAGMDESEKIFETFVNPGVWEPANL